MTKLIVFIFGVILLGMVGAYYAGESAVFENPLSENLIWTIIDNTTSLEILPEINYNQTNISIFFPADMPPQSFTIVFLNEQTREVVKEVQVSSGGGGHSHTIEVVNNTIIKEIPNYIDRKTIVYVNQTQDNPIYNEAQPQIEEDVKGISGWWFVVTAIVIGWIIYFVAKKILKRNEYTNERRYRNNEQSFNA
jgi:hypothetical protein